MMSCRQCKYFKRVDVDTDQWTCGDSVSWCNPNTGEEVCRYWQGAIQREPQPQDIVNTQMLFRLQEKHLSGLMADNTKN